MLWQILAKKMTVLYKLAREQLSKQYHYDFGLRALKSVLVMAGELKRSAADLPEVSETAIMIVIIMEIIVVTRMLPINVSIPNPRIARLVKF